VLNGQGAGSLSPHWCWLSEHMASICLVDMFPKVPGVFTGIVLIVPGFAPTTSSKNTSRANKLDAEMLERHSICPPFLLRYNYWIGGHSGTCSGNIDITGDWPETRGSLPQALAVAFKWISLWFGAHNILHCYIWEYNILHCYDRNHRTRKIRITQAVMIFTKQ